jgi:uncharacterized protein DUF899
MTNERGNQSHPPVTDQATYQAALDELRAREKAHTREGDAIAAARRRLPMVEVDARLPLTGPGGPLTLLGPPAWTPVPAWPAGRPLSQWPRLAAGHSDNLTAAP